MRVNNRPQAMLRPIKIQRNYTCHAEGSVLISFGQTVVLCTASVQESVPSHKRDTGEGWVTAEYAMLPRATISRVPRESIKGSQTGRTQEIQRLIGRSLRAVVDFQSLGERQIILDCDVLQADGGTRTASITGAYIALHDAVNFLISKEILLKNPLTDFVAAVSVGIVDGELLLDLDYSEDSVADVDLNVVMTSVGSFVEVQGTAERSPFSMATLQGMLSLAEQGIHQIIFEQKQAIERHLF